MASIHLDLDSLEWTSAVPFYGEGARYQGHDIIQLKVLSDRRREGGGIAWLARFLPPPGKLIRIVANALSDEHIINLEGGRANKAGERVRAASGYGLNTTGQPHSAMIATETVSVIVYTGEPDEIVSLDVLDVAPGEATRLP